MRARVLVHEVHREFPGIHAQRQDTDQWFLLMSRLLSGYRWDPPSELSEAFWGVIKQQRFLQKRTEVRAELTGSCWTEDTDAVSTSFAFRWIEITSEARLLPVQTVNDSSCSASVPMDLQILSHPLWSERFQARSRTGQASQLRATGGKH